MRGNVSLELRRSVTAAGLREHAAAFARIARSNGGNRAAGTEGYGASAQYVYDRLKAAGYEVGFEEVPHESYVTTAEEGRELAPTRRDLAAEAMQFSPSTSNGGIEASVALVPVDEDGSHGCEESDFEGGSYAGAIALVRRGVCKFGVKAQEASEAGASAVIVYADFRGEFEGSLGSPEHASIPIVSVTQEVGEALTREAAAGADVVVFLEVEATTATTTRNVIAETRGASEGTVVMAGAHLDSVPEGPGLNDNGSGSAVLLEIAEELAKVAPEKKVRFAFWGAEEAGLVGSRHYVRGLGDAEKERIALYLNLDMVGSRNFVRFVYDGGPAERVLLSYFRARRLAAVASPAGRSDDGPFSAEGIATGGLFTGAGETKTARQARVFGGKAAKPYDPCYHKPCDTLTNVDLAVAHEMADAAAHALATFAAR